MFEAIIFDIDNTLYDYDYCHNKALKYISNEIGINHNEFIRYYNDVSNNLKIQLGNTAASHNRFIYFKHLKDKFNINFDVIKIHNLYWDIYIDSITPFKGVIDYIYFLKKKNVKLAVITDFLTEYQYLKLKKLNLLDVFDIIITSEEVGVEKPNINIFYHCLNKLNLSASKVAMIGDSQEKDVVGCINSGIYPIKFSKNLINYSFKINEKSIEFNSYEKLLEFFIKLDIEIESLSVTSKYYGERFDLVQAGGCNISIKFDEYMLIKSSGIRLSDISKNKGYSLINNKKLNIDIKNGKYDDITKYNLLTNSRASMETYMHSIIEYKYVVHLHPIHLNRILVRIDADEIISNIYSDMFDYDYINYITPGIDLAKKIKSKNIIFLQNHGIIISSNSLKELDELIETIITMDDRISMDNIDAYKNVNVISSYVNNITGKNYVSYYSNELSKFYNLKFDTTFPDKLIYCGVNINNINITNNIFEHISILNKSIYISAETIDKCKQIEEVLKAHYLIILDNNNLNIIKKDEEKKILNLDSEKYRKNL